MEAIMANGVKVVAIDSTWDTSTAMASAFRRDKVHPYLARKGFDVNELKGAAANKQQATAAVLAAGITYVTGVSHGLNDTFTGDQDRPVFETGAYDLRAFPGKIVHFLACNTAFFLGRNLIDPGGAAAFFGYIEAFTWPDDPSGAYADVFFDCDAEIDRALADGESASVAARRTIAKFDQQISALANDGDPAKKLAAAMLERNRDMLRTPSSGREYGSLTAALNGGPAGE
jgi:hypothetical protein